MIKCNILTTFLFFIISNFCFAQEERLKEYSYSEFFELIKTEQDSVFELSDARIKFNPETDSLFSSSEGGLFSKKPFRTDTLFLNKTIKLKSVFFDWRGENSRGLLNHIVFQKKAHFTNVSLGNVDNCIFKENVYFGDTEDFYKEVESFNNTVVGSASQLFFKCRFEKGIYLFSDETSANKIDQWFGILSSEIINLEEESTLGDHSRFHGRNYEIFQLQDNIFKGPKRVNISISNIERFIIENNNFSQPVRLEIPDDDVEFVSINGNIFEYPTLLEWNNYSGNYSVGWEQFENGIINNTSYFNFFDYQNPVNPNTQEPFTNKEKISSEAKQHYLDVIRIRNRGVFKSELKLRSKFLGMYREQYDNEFGNMVYTQMKDLETERLAYLNQVDPSFKNFFTWKINQFLKVFSAYGTEPARAIVYSVYVILLFALIYLFFPNSWDRYGRKRIMARYSFFIKYMKKDGGIHKLHLENKKADLMEYEEFKNLVVSSKKNIPDFFYATALPLYKWSISGTKFSASLLKRVDIMKGKWEELPAHKRLWKSTLLVGTFLIAVLYDIFVKMLNALMLSLNTFTTLGFGEIPIKGLPRYLAIIEGFIGWFMLTIFSVSLISQLLN